jgi:hypothetical protein
MGDDDRARRAAIIRKRKPALDVEFEAGEGGVVADGRHDVVSNYTQQAEYSHPPLVRRHFGNSAQNNNPDAGCQLVHVHIS